MDTKIKGTNHEVTLSNIKGTCQVWAPAAVGIYPYDVGIKISLNWIMKIRFEYIYIKIMYEYGYLY